MQDNGIAKRDIKDSVFRRLFSDSEYLLQLYQTLHPDILSFKETYFPGQECCIDAWAKLIYLDDSDSIINQYIKFCLVYTQQAKIYGYTLTAIKNTIRICKEQNLLRNFLESREMEVEDIMLTLFNQSHVTDTYGLYMMSKGEACGEVRGEEKIVRNMLLAGM